MAGPPAHPVFGNFLTMASLDKVPYRAWASLTRDWGPVLRMVMGPTLLVSHQSMRGMSRVVFRSSSEGMRRSRRP